MAYGKYGRTYKNYETQMWVSYKPEKFLVGIDKLGNELYTGDTVQYYDGYNKKYVNEKINDTPSFSNFISVGNWQYPEYALKLIKH